MKETQRIQELFSDLYDGKPWLDVTLMGSLKNIDAAVAQFRISEKRNSIWEIVNHIILWRKNVLERLDGKTPLTPENNYFEPQTDVSEHAWKQTLKKLEHSQQQWLNAVQKFDEKKFDISEPVNPISLYKHIHGVLQHDAYHLGQINLLLRLHEETT